MGYYLPVMDITIEGMHCSACVRRVRAAIEKVPGAKAEDVQIGTARVSGADEAAVLAAIEQAGFAARKSAS